MSVARVQKIMKYIVSVDEKYLFSLA